MVNPLVYEISSLIVVSGVFAITYLRFRKSHLQREETLLQREETLLDLSLIHI